MKIEYDAVRGLPHIWFFAAVSQLTSEALYFCASDH